MPTCQQTMSVTRSGPFTSGPTSSPSSTSSQQRGSPPRRRPRSAADTASISAICVVGVRLDHGRVVLARASRPSCGRCGSSAGTARTSTSSGSRVAKTSAVHSWIARSAKSLPLVVHADERVAADDPPARPQRRPPLPRSCRSRRRARPRMGSPRISACTSSASSVTSSSPMSVSPPDEVRRRDRPAPAGRRGRSRDRTTAGCRRRRPRRRGGTCPRSGSGSAAAAVCGRAMPMRARSRATPSSVMPRVTSCRLGHAVLRYRYGLGTDRRPTGRPLLDRSSSDDEVRARRRGSGSTSTCPTAWRDAAARGGRAAIRKVRRRADYEAWYPTFADSGLAVATWPVAYGGLDLGPGAGAGRRGRPRAVQPRAAEPARPEQRGARPSSPTAPRSSACGSCRRSCATRRSGASC